MLASQAIARLAMFYKHESCGQCTPCREVSELKYLKHWKLSLQSKISPWETPSTLFFLGYRLDEYNDVEVHWGQRAARGDWYDLGTEQTGKGSKWNPLHSNLGSLYQYCHFSCRLRATLSALWLTALLGQSRVLSGTSGQSWKTGEHRLLLLTFPSTWSNIEILLKFSWKHFHNLEFHNWLISQPLHRT